jgi:phosphoribosyl 1,2-cyclic phosphodiesterase
VRVHFLGVRGSTPAPGREFDRYGGHTSCVALSLDGESAPTLVLDAGTGVRSCTALCKGAFSGTIILSHLHWDHLHGLPFFSAADRDDARANVLVPDPLDGDDAIAVLARGMSPPHFPVRPEELRGDWRFELHEPGERLVEGFTVVTREVPHKGGRTYGFRVSDGHSVLTYMPDHCPSALGPGPDGWGEYHPDAMALASGADVLVHDAQLVAEELPREADFGHSAGEYAVELARKAGSRRVVLLHHKPDRSDDALDEIARRFTGQPVTTASQSLVLDL